MKYHEAVGKIRKLLEREGFWFEVFEHQPVRTSEEAAKVRSGYSLKQGAKAIILKVKKPGGECYHVMLVLPGDKRFDSKKVKQVLGAKDVSLASEQEVRKITKGVRPGGVPPLGNIFELTVIADASLFELDKIIFNAGDKRVSIAMRAEDYRKIVNPKVEEIIK